MHRNPALCVNTLRPRQNGRHFADDNFNRIFVNENVRISIKFSLKFVPKDPINNIPTLVQVMACRRPGDKPLSEPMMVRLLTHICVIRPRSVKCGFMKSVAFQQTDLCLERPPNYIPGYVKPKKKKLPLSVHNFEWKISSKCIKSYSWMNVEKMPNKCLWWK